MVKKITTFLFMAAAIFISFLVFPKNSYATKRGYVDCSSSPTCSNLFQKTCIPGCPPLTYDCGINCPGGGGCVPSCAGVQCGDDGCGGSCGTCGGGTVCSGGLCVPVCSTSTPTNLSVTRVSSTKATITWTLGGGGNSQQLRVGANLTEVNSNCPGTDSPTCVVKEDALPVGQSSYTTGDVLVPNTVYYWRVITYRDAGCNSPANTTSASSCSLNPSALTLTTGQSGSLLSLMNSSSDIQRVDFSSGNAGVATVNPGSDVSYIYQTTVNAVAPGSTNISGNVYFTGGTLACTNSAPITVTPPSPWWQVVDADVATNSDLNSKVPAGKLFDTIGGGGYPGIPAYGGVTNLAAGKISTNGWLAASSISSTKAFGYNFFSQAIPSDTVFNVITTPNIDGSFLATGGAKSGGYYWYKFDGTAGATSGLDLTITNPASIGSRKVVLLVGSANLNLKGNINLTKGQGFFMAIVGKDVLGNKGKITVDPTVGGGGTNLEGIYFADGTISTGTTGAKNDSQLKFRGSVSANGGISLQRDLGGPANTTTPAEIFEYAPDQIMLFPKILGVRKINWKEVAP